ncbi:MAG: restriction endonuclease subunit S [Prevotella sp.]|nr:restriction endonuclease subunit S [Staphylococcus sp.]MCM1350064.1 restriction endonuclease subunit S [Prevotella sp.]
MSNDMNTSSWKKFKLDALFDIERGKRLVELDRDPGNIPFATAGYINQGISDFISNDDIKIYENKITIDMFCNVFYRDYKFGCDDNILVLIPKEFELSKYSALFFATIISQDKDKFPYGRQYRKKDFVRHEVVLPVDSNGNIDFDYIDSYMRKIWSSISTSVELLL